MQPNEPQNEPETTPEAVPAAPGPAPEPAPEGPPEVAFSWQASEYVHHHKSMTWYAGVFVVVVVLVAIAAWLKLWLEIALFLVMGAAVVVYARKPPRTMMYELSADGVQIDGKQYPFSSFRSFAVIPDEEWHSIDLEPAKKFAPRLVLLFDDEDFETIVGHLALHLPREDREPDLIERFTRYIRF